MRILSVKQLKPIQLTASGFVFPMGMRTKIDLDTKSKSSKKLHELVYQSDLRHFGNAGDCCEYLTNDDLLMLEEKGMIEIRKAGSKS